jgi:xylulose-5-phosphate/fructose-6-phosphate phosphoketolase
MATAGDYVTEEAVIGTLLFKERFPQIKVQFVNFFKLDILSENNNKVSREDILKKYLTEDKGIVFNYHGYPASIKKLLFDYHVSERTVINGYEEEGSTTTPFDMKSRNGLSRFHVVKDLAEMSLISDSLSETEVETVHEEMDNLIKEEREYITEHKEDPDYIKHWSV